MTLASFILISTNGKRPVTLATESSEPHKKVSPASAVGLEKSRLFIERESSTLSPSFTVPDVTWTEISNSPSPFRNGSTPPGPALPE